MALSSRSLLLVATSLAAAVLAVPSEADACSPDPCMDSSVFTQFDAASGSIATDGVLAFRIQRYAYNLDDAQALDYVQVEVVDELGMPVAGTLELSETWRLALWRPVAPLEPTSTYQVSVFVDNEAISLEHDIDVGVDGLECSPNIQHDFPLTSGGALPPVAAFATAPTSNHTIEEIRALDTLVCCDGAMPLLENYCGFDDVYWNEGLCAAMRGHGWLEAGFTLDAGALAPEVAADLAIELVGPGSLQVAAPGASQITMRGDTPVCLHVEITSLATGESVANEEVCFGDDVAAELGELAIDPSAGLQACVGEPYTCAVQGDEWSGSWDPATCEPWDGGDDGDSGDAGDADGGSGDDGPLDGGSWGDEGDAGDAGEGDASGQDGDGGQNDGGIADRGCSCRSSATPAGTLGWLAIVLVAIRRRR